jgi:hypothetical protein
MTEDRTDRPNIHVESHGQRGGITAGTVNIQVEPVPTARLSEMTHHESPEGHIYEAVLTINSRYSLPSVVVTARAQTIQSLHVGMMRTGLQMTGHSGRREGYCFTTLLNAVGQYQVQVITAEPEEVVIDLEG